MSSSVWWTAHHNQGSRAHQRVSRTSMQAANNLSEDDASSQTPELDENESSHAKTARILGLVLVVLLGLGLVSNMFPDFLMHEMIMLQQLVLLLVPVLVLAPVQILERYWRDLILLLLVVVLSPRFTLWRLEVKHMVTMVLLLILQRVVRFWHAHMHRHDELVKWEPHEWVLDSGTWIHHTSKLELLLEGGDFRFQEMDNIDAPSIGNDAALHTQGHGSIRTGCFEFPGVHYVVGDDTRNVVSVSQLARDHGLVTVFEPTSCHVKDKKTGQIIGKGRLRNGMYMLDSLRIIGQYIGDRGASGEDRHDGADGGGGGRGHQARGNGEADSTAEGRGGGGRDSRGGGGTGARNQEEGSGSGAVGGDVNEINEVEGGDRNEIEETNDNDEDGIEEIGEINKTGENEEDEKKGGQNSGQLSSRQHTGLFGLSLFGCLLSIAAFILLLYTRLGAVMTKLATDFHNPAVFNWFVLNLLLIIYVVRSASTTKDNGEETWGAHLQQLSHQEHNKRLFGLSRFDVTTDPTGYRRRQLPARAFASSPNAARQEVFFVDLGASFHTTWNESILFHYPRYLHNHTKPPTLSLGGIASGSIPVTRTGYLNSNKIMLDGVLLAPEAQANLVSVGQLSIYYGVQVEMDEVGVVIKKKHNGVQIGGGKIVGNLYVLEYFLPGGLFAHCHTPQP